MTSTLRTAGARIALCMIAVGTLTPVRADTITVTAGAGADDDGNPSNGVCTLEEAINVANTDVGTNDCPHSPRVQPWLSIADTIQLADSETYTPNTSYNLDENSSITIEGGGTATIDGSNGNNFFYVNNAGTTLTLSNVHMTQFDSTSALAAGGSGNVQVNVNGSLFDDNNNSTLIWVSGASLSMTGTSFTGNGGSQSMIAADSADVSITGGTISLNDYGSALIWGGNTPVSLSNVAFTGNRAGSASSLASLIAIGSSGSLTDSGSTFTNNMGTFYLGTSLTNTLSGTTFNGHTGNLSANGGTLVISNATIDGFTGANGYGAAFYFGNDTTTITSTTFTNGAIGASSSNFIYASASSFTMQDSEISSTTASGSVLYGSSAMTITRSLLANNTANDGIVYAGANGNTIFTNTFAANTVGASGAAMYANGDTGFGANTVYGTLGGAGVLFGSGSSTIASTIVGNTALAASDVVNNIGASLTKSYNLTNDAIVGGTGGTGDQTGAFTLTLANNGGSTRTYLPPTAATNKGACFTAPFDQDQRGLYRPGSNAACDTGAVEADGVAAPTGAIPTLSEWGMIAFFLMLGGTMVYNMRRRQGIVA